MSKVSCPFCYHGVDGARLWYQCTGRGSPGRPGCKPEPDEARARETGFVEAVRPSFGADTRGSRWPAKAGCPRCGAESGIRTCPACHTPVPANFGAASSPLIAMVGAKGTGKTVFLNVLGHELLHGLRRRFGADVRMSGTGRRKSMASTLMIDDVFTGHRLMAQTAEAVNGRREPAVFEWRQEHRIAGIARGYRTTFLSFYDTAGEDLTSQESTHDLTYLGAADSLILLLDPFQIPAAAHRIRLPDEAVINLEPTIDVVNRVTEKLRVSHSVRPNRRIRIPVAVAFAKIDAFFDLLGPDHPLLRQPAPTGGYDESAGLDAHEHVRGLLLDDWDAGDIDTHLRFNYENFRYFAVSALGAPPDYRTGEVDPGGVRPFRVAEPLLWLLSQFNIVPRQRT
jgi:hypothetical protein